LRWRLSFAVDCDVQSVDVSARTPAAGSFFEALAFAAELGDHAAVREAIEDGGGQRGVTAIGLGTDQLRQLEAALDAADDERESKQEAFIH